MRAELREFARLFFSDLDDETVPFFAGLPIEIYKVFKPGDFALGRKCANDLKKAHQLREDAPAPPVVESRGEQGVVDCLPSPVPLGVEDSHLPRLPIFAARSHCTVDRLRPQTHAAKILPCKLVEHLLAELPDAADHFFAGTPAPAPT